MDYRLLGRTGIRVSPFCLGTMMFGGQTTEADSTRIIHKALDLGINFIDTADMYVAGESEKIVGNAIDGRRDKIVLATKGRHKMGEAPNDWGASRLHMRQALDASLQRLNDRLRRSLLHSRARLRHTDRRDAPLFRRRGASRQNPLPGLLQFSRWRVCEALWTSDKLGFARFAAVQPLYNLVNRDIEVELLPLCQAHGLGVVSYSPLGPRHSDRQVQAGRGVPRRQPSRPQRQAHERSRAAPRKPGDLRAVGRSLREERRRAVAVRASPGAWPIPLSPS